MRRDYTESIHYLVTRYIFSVKATCQSSTYRRYWQTLERFFEGHQDKRFPEEFHGWDIRDYVDSRVRKGVSSHTINSELSILRSFWSWLIDRELATYNPARTIKNLENPAWRRKSLSREAIEKILSRCVSLQDKLIILLPLTTGLRRDELAKLQWKDVDLEKGTIQVGKLVFPLRPDIREMLADFYDGRRKYVLRTSRVGNPKRLQIAFKNIMARADMYPIPNFTVLRQTFTSFLYRTGFEPPEVYYLSRMASKTRAIAIPPTLEDILKALEDFPRG